MAGGPPVNTGGTLFGGSPGTHENRAVGMDTGPGHVLFRAVVVEVFADPVDITAHMTDEETKAALDLTIKNVADLWNAPRNSISARIITAGKDKKSEPKLDDTPGTIEAATGESIAPDMAKGHEGAYIMYPFFPPHLSMPVKPGEQVWVINEIPGGGTSAPRWVCRIPEPSGVDDINYTHGDRKFATNFEVGLVAKAAGITTDPPGFNNGGDQIPDLNGAPLVAPTDRSLTGESDYEEIITTSIAYASFTPEPVPRLTNRAADLVIQGSNNTAIIMGEDRGWTIADTFATAPETSNATTLRPDDTGMGTIDIVTGRGRHMPAEGDEPSRTAPYTIENTRGDIEVDKTVQPVAEGDPDFEYDASRIYVSMNTTADSNFGLEYPNIPTWSDSGTGPDNVDGAAPVNTDLQSHIVMKSDNIRIVARRSEKDLPFSGVEEINGSIRIIKEGVEDAEDGTGRAVIIIEPDGTIMIDGPTVVIGSGGLEKGNGEGTQVILGRGATEPLVLGQILADLLDEFFQEILDFLAKTYDAHVHPGAVPIAPPLIPSAMDQAAIEITKGNISTILSKLGKLK